MFESSLGLRTPTTSSPASSGAFLPSRASNSVPLPRASPCSARAYLRPSLPDCVGCCGSLRDAKGFSEPSHRARSDHASQRPQGLGDFETIAIAHGDFDAPGAPRRASARTPLPRHFSSPQPHSINLTIADIYVFQTF